MPTVFRINTSDAYTIKILIELLHNILKIGCFEIHPSGIKMRMMDSQRRMLIDIWLNHEKFDLFEMVTPEPIFMGINLNHLYRMLKSIKKKDSLSIYMEMRHPDKLFLEVSPKDQNRVSISSVYVHSAQNVEIALPADYGSPISVSSSEFQCAIKDLVNINDTVAVSIRAKSLSIKSSTKNIFSREVRFGSQDDESAVTYEGTFDMEQFSRILKIAGLSQTVLVLGSSNAIAFRSAVGSLGFMSVCIKSKEQIQLETCI